MSLFCPQGAYYAKERKDSQRKYSVRSAAVEALAKAKSERLI